MGSVWGGHRRCPGYALAEMQIKLSLAVFLRHYQLERTDSKSISKVIRKLIVVPEPSPQMRVVTQR